MSNVMKLIKTPTGIFIAIAAVTLLAFMLECIDSELVGR